MAISSIISRPSKIIASTADISESLDKLIPADVYFGRGKCVLFDRERIKRYRNTNRLQLLARAARLQSQ